MPASSTCDSLSIDRPLKRTSVRTGLARGWPPILALAGAILGALAGLSAPAHPAPVAGSAHAAAARPAQGDPVIDQTTCAEPWSGTAGFPGATQKAQTFVPGMDGRLAYVDLPGTNGGGTSRLQVWLTDGCGIATGRLVASSEVTDGTRFPFAEQPLLHAGGFYALVASDAGGSRYAWAYSSRDDCYPSRYGSPYTSMDGGQRWSRDIVDFFFTTWMIPDAAQPTALPTVTPTPSPTPWPTPPPGTAPYLMVDQSTCDEPAVNSVAVQAGVGKAQTFVAGVDGALAWVALPSANEGGRTTLTIHGTDASGFPNGAALGTAAVECSGVFRLAAPVHLTGGRVYALVVSHPGASGAFHWYYSGSRDCYHDPRGAPFTTHDDGQTWTRDQVDFHFATYMVPDVAQGKPAAMPDDHGCARPPLAGAVVRDVEDARAGNGGRQSRPPGMTAADRATASSAARTGSADGTRDRDAVALEAALARAAQRPPAATTRTVFVIALPTGNSDPTMLLQKSRDLSAAIREATSYHGYADPDAQPFLDYAIYQDTVFVETTMPPRCTGDYDLGTLFDKYHLCSLIQQQQVDEVWFWEGGFGGLPEFAISGPELSIVGGTGMPNCGRQAALMVYHNGLDLGYALHSLGHRMEMTMRRYRPCDFTSATWPWPQAVAGCRDGSASDATGFVARPGNRNGRVGACGDVHWPPNIAQGMQQEYDYANPAKARSICQDWRRDGKAAATEISCATWGCSQLGYMLWWMQNIPGLDNASRDRRGDPMPNWWPLLFGTGNPTPAPRPTTAATPTPTASSTPMATATPTASPTPMVTAMPTTSPTPTPSPLPPEWRAFLPCALVP